MRLSVRLLHFAALVFLARPVLADSFTEGRELYKAGNYSGAASKLEQASKEFPNEAKVWWQLNFAYNKVGRAKDSLRAVETAGQLDPARGFASDPGKYDQILADRQRSAGVGSPVTPPSGSGGSVANPPPSIQPTDAGGESALFIVGTIAVIGVLVFAIRSVSKSKALADRKPQLEKQKADVVEQLNFLDDNVAVLDAAAATKVKEARLRAGTKLDDAIRILSRARSEKDLNQAQTLLDQAQADIASGRTAIAGGAPSTGESKRGGSFGAGKDHPDWNAVPQEQRGVCFFCSQPALLKDLAPVTTTLEGRQQKVLACKNDLATIRTGSVPHIRAFSVGGRFVPWYAYHGYDPYVDYYGRGYDAGDLLTDLVVLSAVDNMYWNWSHPVGWDWGYGGGPMAFYPDHDYYQDYYSGQAAGYSDLGNVGDPGQQTYPQDPNFQPDPGGQPPPSFGQDHS